MAITMGVIFFLSHQSGQTLPLPPIVHLDKLLHILIYGLLALTTLWVPSSEWHLNKPLLVAFIVIAVGLVYGVLDEYHQSFIPGRNSSLEDILADVTGSILVCLAWGWNKIFQKDS